MRGCQPVVRFVTVCLLCVVSARNCLGDDDAIQRRMAPLLERADIEIGAASQLERDSVRANLAAMHGALERFEAAAMMIERIQVSEDRNAARFVLAMQLAEKKDFAGALRLIAAARRQNGNESGFADQAVGKVAYLLAREGREQEALVVRNELPTREARVCGYFDVAKSCAEDGQSREASNWLRGVIDRAADSSEPGQAAKCRLAAIASVESMEEFEIRLNQFVDTVTGSSRTSWMVAEAATRVAEVATTQRAIAVAMRVPDEDGKRLNCLEEVAETRLRQGDVSGVLDLIEDRKNPLEYNRPIPLKLSSAAFLE